MYSFALIRLTPLPMFSDTAITDRHSDTTVSSSEHTECRYPGLLNQKYSLVEIEPNSELEICVQRTGMSPPSALSKMALWLRYWLLSDNSRSIKADL